MSIAVIAVGGLGRGVCNWLKQRLENEYGSVAGAGFTLLVVDGPVDDEQYMLPDGSQIDTSPQSTVFYGLSELPGPAIKAIAAGGTYPYVDRWFVQAEAQQIANPDRIIPSTGYGQVRPAGRVGFFLEASRLVDVIESAVDKCSVVILVGSQSGGTGSGMLVDVAHVIRSLKPTNAPFHGYIALPSGFSHVFGQGEGVRRGNTRGFAGMRELEHQRMSPSPIEFCSGVTTSNVSLFDGCHLVDGLGDTKLGKVPPVYGVCPCIADHIVAVYGTPVAGTEAANWQSASVIEKPGTPADAGYWAPGCFTYLYEWRAVQEAFAHRFAADVYDALLTVKPEEAAKGENLAEGALRTTGPGSLAIELATKGALAVSWPLLNQPDTLSGLLTLRGNLSTASPASTNGPMAPHATLLDWVELTGIFRRVDNADVIAQCHDFTRRHLGAPVDDPNPNADASLWAWLGHQRRTICREFIVQLTNELQELFYDSQQGTWRSLGQEPYTLSVARDLLRACRNLLQKELDEIRKIRTQFADAKAMARAEELRRRAETDLLNQKTNKAEQRAFVEGIAQWYHDLCEWDALSRAYDLTLGDMLRLSDDLWTKIGAPAEGWIGYLQDCHDSMQRAHNHGLTARRKAAQHVGARQYVPQPGGLAENVLYHNEVKEQQHRDTLLAAMSWSFQSTLNQPGTAFSDTVDAGDIAASFDCYLHVPPVPNYQAPDPRNAGLYDGVDGTYRQTVVSRHQPEAFVQYERNLLETPLEQKSIWDMLLLESSANNITPQALASDVQAKLVSMSEVSLDLVGSENSEEDRYEVCVHSAKSEISMAVADGLNGKGYKGAGVDPNSPFKHSLAAVRVATNFTLPQWVQYDETRNDYYEWRRSLPVHCYPEERIATDYVEEYLLKHHVAQVGQMPLHHTVCRHLRNWPQFQAFAVCFALLASDLPTPLPLADTGGGPDSRALSIPSCPTGAGHMAVCKLGLACNMDGVLNTLMASNPLCEQARGLMVEYCDDLAKRALVDAELRAPLVERLSPKAPADLLLPQESTATTNKEQLNRQHLQWALWAAVHQFREGVLGS